MSGNAGPIAGPTTYEAAAWDRIMGEWVGWWTTQLDAKEDWNREGLTLAQRAWRLVLNDPYATALINTICTQVLGGGLWWQSQYQLDPDGEPTDGDHRARRALSRVVRAGASDFRLDPSGLLTRRRIDLQALVSGWVTGDGFGIRTWDPTRPGCAGYGTCWRVLDSARVGNPEGCANEPGILYDGIEFKRGSPYALHWYDPLTAEWDNTLWWSDDGSRNVLHYAPDRARAGSVRGFSKFAPLLKLATHLARVAEAHVMGKRIQASHPMFIQSADPNKSAEEHRRRAQFGPNSGVQSATIAYIGNQSDVKFPSFSYQGQDFQSFVESQLVAFCASWGLPWQVVMCQLTNANLAAAQAALDQVSRVCGDYQSDFIAEWCQPMDESVLREALARQRVVTIAEDWDTIRASTYDRPRLADANRQRSRQAAQLNLSLGISPSTTSAELGYNWAEEIRRTAADIAMANAHGVRLPGLNPAPAPAAEPDGNETDEVDPDAADDTTAQPRKAA